MKLKMYQEKTSVGLQGVKHIIGVMSGKGGVGKSTFTASLAIGLKEKGYRVGILDGDLYGPSMDVLLPKDQSPEQTQEGITPALSNGIRLVSMSYLKADQGAAIIRAPIANQLLKQFLGQVKWGELDYLLIDFPPGTGDIQLTLGQLAPIKGAILVSQPQRLSKIDVEKAWEMLKLMQIPVIGYVENMSYFQAPNQETCTLFSTYRSGPLSELPLLQSFPLDPQISKACDEGSLKELAELAPEFYEKLEKLVEQVEVFSEGKALDQEVEVILINPNQIAFHFPSKKQRVYQASELQRRCQCSYCLEHPPSFNEQVRIKRFQRVGNYGVRLYFSSGCDKGIYHFEKLEMGFEEPSLPVIGE